MKRFQVIFLFVFLLAGCSSNQPILPSTSPAPTITPLVLPSVTPAVTPIITRESSPTLASTEITQPILPVTPLATPTPGTFTLSTENIKEITLLKQWGKGTPTVTTWSPNGKLFLVGTSIGVYIYDAQTMSEIRFIKTGESIRELAISSDSKILATGSNRVILWNIETGKSIETLTGAFNGFISYLSFSPGGSLLAAFGTEGGGGDPPATLRIWQTSDWSSLYTKESISCGYGSSFAFSPDGRTIALKVCSGISLLQSSTGEFITSTSIGVESENAVFANNGNTLIGGTSIDSVSLIDLQSQEIIKSFATSGYTEIIVSPNGQNIAVLGVWDDDRKLWTMEIWNIETGQRKFIIDDYHYGVSFGSDEKQLSAINKNGDLEFRDAETGSLIKKFPWTSTVNCVSFGIFEPNEGTKTPVLITGNKAGQVILINPDNRETIQTITISDRPVSSVAIHPNGYILAAGVADTETANIILYDLRSGQFIKEIKISNQPYAVGVWGLAFSMDGQAVAAKTSTFNYIEAWNINSGELLSNPSQITWYNSVDIGGDSSGHLFDLEFISTDGGYSGTYQISDSNTGEIFASSLSIEDTGICQNYEHYSISYDRHYFALGCDLWTLPVWNLENQVLVHNFENHVPSVWDGGMGNITYLIFNPYGYLLASSGYDNTIRFWNVQTGQLLITIFEHSCIVSDIAFSMDGQYLASTSCDGTLRLWGLQR